jgi:hypothetical protein
MEEFISNGRIGYSDNESDDEKLRDDILKNIDEAKELVKSRLSEPYNGGDCKMNCVKS